MKPRISESEFLERKHKVQGFMEDQGLDLVVMYADDRYVYGLSLIHISERVTGHIGTETRPKLLREAAVGNIAQWGKP